MSVHRWRSRAGAGRRIPSGALLVAGLLALSCGTVDLNPPPADVNACRPSQLFFAEHIWPEFLGQSYNGQTCGDARCHDPASGRPFRSERPTSVPSYPFAPQSDWEKSYLSVTQQVTCSNVRGSELYTRPAGLRTHGGGRLIEPDGPEATLLDMWVVSP